LIPFRQLGEGDVMIGVVPVMLKGVDTVMCFIFEIFYFICYFFCVSCLSSLLFFLLYYYSFLIPLFAFCCLVIIIINKQSDIGFFKPKSKVLFMSSSLSETTNGSPTKGKRKTIAQVDQELQQLKVLLKAIAVKVGAEELKPRC
jgi:hypothetical protein